MQHDLRAPKSDVPATAGVYVITDPDGFVAYVGESSNLRNRLRTHASGDWLKSAVAYSVIVGVPVPAEQSELAAIARDRLAGWTYTWEVTEDRHTREAELIAEHSPRLNA